MALLKLNSTGDEVKTLQLNLKKLGYTIGTDGIFGNETLRNVIAFQKANGLAPDGIVGSNTQTVIADLLKAKPIYGLDISHWQGVINWGNVNPRDANFVFCKSSQGRYYKDDVLAPNYAHLEQLGIMRGVYHFLTFKDVTAAQQVQNFLGCNIDFSKKGVLPPVVDVEWQAGSPSLDAYIRQNQAECQQKLRDWLNAVENATGRTPIIYTAAGFWNDLFGNPAGFENYPLWVATYGPSQPIMPGKWKKYLIWQFTGSGQVPGIAGQVDRNIFNGTLAELKKLANF